MRIQKHTFVPLQQKSRSRWARGATAALLCLGVAGSASAGTVYSWTTEAGTSAYTDDRKRIPARYRGSAKSRSTEQLSRYARFTPSTVTVAGDAGERLLTRLNHLRGNEAAASGGGAVAMMAPGPGGQPMSAAFLVRMSGNRDRTTTQMGIPLHGSSAEPIVVENLRVRPDSTLGDRGSMATHHVTVVRQGDRVISLTRPELNQRSLAVPRESDILR